MVSNSKIGMVYRPWQALVTALLCLCVSTVAADTYRWKDKDGKVHYGSAVPAEYADQPYDILNEAGLIIDHVEDTSIPEDVREEIKSQERAPLISQEERDRQYDRLLVIQYRSEEEIGQAMNFELAQLDYDKEIINQSYESTANAIKQQVKQAADQQRANQQLSDEQEKAIEQLYARHATDEDKRLILSRREAQIRARFKRDLDRYRFLTAGVEAGNEDSSDQD
jgi:hypothetical protein